MSSGQKRMGAYNALDELLPGPPSGGSRLDERTARHARRIVRPGSGRLGSVNALDELLPGPETEQRVPQRPHPSPRPASRTARRPRGSALGPYHALADLPEGWLPTDPSKVHLDLHVDAALAEDVKDAAAYLSGPPTHLNLSRLAERALRREVDRLAAEHHGGRPFPPRHADPT